MNIAYCFSSPDGDIHLSPKDLESPFKTTPQTEHPHLILKDYFKALEDFILGHNRDRISDLAGFREITKLIIRSEKHGVLYHIASVDISDGNEVKRFGLGSAVTENGRNTLRQEFEIITRLKIETRLPYLPETFSLAEVTTSPGDRQNTILVALMEWFEDYHEWHLDQDESGRQQKLIIWDQQRGYRFALESESAEIYRQAARILTLYYDPVTYRQIYPWHHAAGDFIVKTGHTTEVRLTTARRYDSIMGSWETDNIPPIIAAIYFFLNLTVRMRLDRQQGTANLIWAGEYVLAPVIHGFLQGLLKKVKKKRFPEEVNKLPFLLKSFTRLELEKLLYSLLPVYEKEDPEEYEVIQNNLPAHAVELKQTLGKMK